MLYKSLILLFLTAAGRSPSPPVFSTRTGGSDRSQRNEGSSTHASKPGTYQYLIILYFLNAAQTIRTLTIVEIIYSKSPAAYAPASPSPPRHHSSMSQSQAQRHGQGYTGSSHKRTRSPSRSPSPPPSRSRRPPPRASRSPPPASGAYPQHQQPHDNWARGGPSSHYQNRY